MLEGVRGLSQETAPHPTQDRGYVLPDLVFLGSQHHSAVADTHQEPKEVWDETHRREAEAQREPGILLRSPGAVQGRGTHL